MLVRTLAIACLGLQASPAPLPQVTGFTWRPGAVPVGKAYHYRKSNLDGSNASEIVLYLASETRLEALKHHAGETESTLVVAEMDWQVFSVSTFRTLRLTLGKEPALVAEFATSGDRKRITGKLGAQVIECELPGFPWHSYDFDFSSLNVALRFLTAPEGEVELEIVDPVRDGDTPRLGAKGKVTLAYESDERRGEVACRRYVLDGPGLEDRGGTLWVAHGDDPHLVAFEIDLPDEPGMSSGKLEWLRTETLTSEAWQARLRDPESR